MRTVPRVIAGTEFRRTLRIIFADPTKVLTLGVLAIIGVGPMLLGLGLGGYLLGTMIHQGVLARMVPGEATVLIRGTVAVAWIVICGLAILRASTQTATLSQPDMLLISTSVRNIVVGVIYGELVRFALVLLPLTALFAIPMAHAMERPGVAIALIFLVFFLLLTAVPVGFPIGVGIRHLVTTYRPIARLRVPLILGLLGGYLALLLTGRFGPGMVWLAEVAQQSALGWPGEVILHVLPTVTGDPWPVVGAIALTVLVIPIALEIGVWVATIHWYRDRGHTAGGLRWPDIGVDRIEGLTERWVNRPAFVICVTTLRRTKRAPIRMLYVSYPVLGSIFFIAEIIRRGEIPLVFFVIVSVYMIWAIGALVTLNPLGDLGPAIPTVVASPLSGATVMRGYRLAAWGIGIPLAIVVVASAAIFGTMGNQALGWLAVGTVAGTLLVPSVALGIGSMFPRFGSVRVARKREAVMPSKLAFGIYSSVLSVPTTAAIFLASPFLLERLTDIVAILLGLLGEEAAAVTLWIVRIFLLFPIVIALPLAVIGFRFACYRYEQFWMA